MRKVSCIVSAAVGVALAVGGSVGVGYAQEDQQESKPVIPTLLIKGEVVSLDANDPTATLLTVKDRYGFETPIFLTPETKISQGDQALATQDLTSQTAVEVEYTFDINTAKRHALSVKVAESNPAVTQASMPVTPGQGTSTETAPATEPAPSMTPASDELSATQASIEGEPASAQ